MTLTIGLLSDLHLERGGTRPSVSSATDVLVLAGDIHNGTARRPAEAPSPAIAVAQAYQQELDIPVVIVMGNHECYGSSVALTEQCMRQAAATAKDIHFLEKDEVVLGRDEGEPGVNFLGTCLWANSALYADMPTQGDATLQQLQSNFATRSDMVQAYQDVIEHTVNDFTHITPRYGTRTFSTQQAEQLYDGATRWLSTALRSHQTTNPAMPSVVVTHFAPSPVCIAPQFMHEPITPYFVNYLDPLIAESGPTLWLHGHTHYSVDTIVANTRIISNQKGYAHEPDANYQPDRVYTV